MLAWFFSVSGNHYIVKLLIGNKLFAAIILPRFNHPLAVIILKQAFFQTVTDISCLLTQCLIFAMLKSL
jgi:hypothetical protein